MRDCLWKADTTRRRLTPVPFVYMLRCSDDSFYVGSTKYALEARVQQHVDGEGAAYTRRRRPVELVWAEEFARVDDAFAREKQVQNWSRAKRIALIEQRYADLPALAERGSLRRRRGATPATPPG